MKNSNKVLWLGAISILIMILILSVSMRHSAVTADNSLSSLDFSHPPTHKTLVGNGKMKNTTISEEKFNSVNVNGQFSIVLQPGKENSTTVSTDENILPFITRSLLNDQLTLGVQQGIALSISQPVNTLITNQAIHSLRLNGKNILHAKDISSNDFSLLMNGNNQGDLQGNIKKLQVTLTGHATLHIKVNDAERINLTVGGNTFVYLSGKVQHLNIITTGNAHIIAKDLLADFVIIQGAGKSNIIVHALKKLSVLVAGKNSIQYYGNPILIKHYFGETTIEKIDEK